MTEWFNLFTAQCLYDAVFCNLYQTQDSGQCYLIPLRTLGCHFYKRFLQNKVVSLQKVYSCKQLR